MLEQLFGSKTRVRLLRLFLNDGKEQYFVRELTRRIGAQINAVRNELDNLIKLGLVVAVEEPTGAAKPVRPQRKKFFRLNTDALIYPELKALFIKSRVLLEKDLVKKLTAGGNLSYLALTGVFVGIDDAPTDLLVVGRLSREKMAPLVRDFQREIGREINYTLLTPQEFRYRREMTDRFLFSILESKKLVVIDTITGQPARPGVPTL